MLARIELYVPGKYDYQVLTVQENWVRQGEARLTQELELWYGRYMKLPFIENMTMRVLAGQTNARGKEVLNNGWFSVKIEAGSYIKAYPETVFDLGPMFTHTKKSLLFKLLVPKQASTKGYFMLDLEFAPQTLRTYGMFPYGHGIYSADLGLMEFHEGRMIYRAFVFDDATWGQLLQAAPSPLYRGEDKKW